MSSGLKKFLAVLIIAIMIFGTYVSIFGIGSVKPLKQSLKYGLDINGGVYVVMEAATKQNGPALKKTMDQTRAVLNNRVNAMGLSEAAVSLEGKKRIRIEMPGVKNSEDAIKQIGKTAQLRFFLADGTMVMTGKDIKDAGIANDSEHGGYKITLQFTAKGQKKFTDATTRASGGTIKSIDENIANNAIVIKLDDKVVTAPTCSQPITSDACDITSQNGYEKEEASNTAALIRGGALPVTLEEVTTSVQTATIGEDALDKSITAGLIGIGLVWLLMLIMYRTLGLLADLALGLYILLELWIMVGLGSVLTLPGIAGIILSIGMAVDANVIIFARIKEEIAKGKSIRVAVSEGFKHALVTVLDAQITTLIAAVVLYEVGSTSVRGFAITLIIGILISIFTAVVVTQLFVGLLAESKRFATFRSFGMNKDGTSRKILKKQFKFIKRRRFFYSFSALIIIAGIVFTFTKGFNYGIDFTGGTMMQIDMGKTVDTTKVEKSLKGFNLHESIVLAGKNQDEVVIKTTKALTAKDRGNVIRTLSKDFGISEKNLMASQQFGPTVGKELKLNALKAILFASVGMLIYIILRFKSWKYGISSIAGIFHDVLVLLSVYAIFGITINNPFIAGILTIVGYSINDTIVIFDRIRENRKLHRTTDLIDNIDNSINQTLNRSIMTSLTTIVCMIPLLVMVSTSIREFVIPLMVGILFGTYSSIFLCSPVLFELSKGDVKSKYTKHRGQKNKKGKK